MGQWVPCNQYGVGGVSGRGQRRGICRQLGLKCEHNGDKQ